MPPPTPSPSTVTMTLPDPQRNQKKNTPENTPSTKQNWNNKSPWLLWLLPGRDRPLCNGCGYWPNPWPCPRNAQLNSWPRLAPAIPEPRWWQTSAPPGSSLHPAVEARVSQVKIKRTKMKKVLKNTEWSSTKQHANFTKESCHTLQKNAVLSGAVRNRAQTLQKNMVHVRVGQYQCLNFTKEHCFSGAVPTSMQTSQKNVVWVGQYKTMYKLYKRKLSHITKERCLSGAVQNNVQTLQKKVVAHYKRTLFEWGSTKQCTNFTEERCRKLQKNAVWYKQCTNFTEECCCML